MKTKTISKIVSLIPQHFSCFGGGQASTWGNPLSEALKDKPPMFAAGVDVEAVVRFVAKELEKEKRLR